MAIHAGERAQVAEMEQHWTKLKVSESARQNLVEAENDGLQSNIESLKFHERHYMNELKRLTDECKSFHDRLQAGPFIALLVDGDNTLFLDEFVLAGGEGGHRAAKKLLDALQSYAKELLDSQAHWRIVVRIFANFHGLVGAYTKSSTVPNARTVEEFLIGFNRELPLFEFVNVGDDKEAADNKIKVQENLSLYWTDEHCKHVALAGSADRGYVSFLRRFRTESSKVTTRLTLIESVPFPSDFKQLATCFHTKSFPTVFRSTKLVWAKEQQYLCPTPANNAHRLSPATATATATAIAALFLAPGTSEPHRNRSHTISSSGSSLPDPGTEVVNVNTNEKKNSESTHRKIYQNRHGQRIDEPLHSWDDQVAKQVRRRQLCPRHFLTKCNQHQKKKNKNNDSEGCRHSHEGEINEEEKYALMRIARDEPCARGTRCMDRNCVAGHHCVWDGRCRHGSSCKYPVEMHSISKKVKAVC